MPKTPKSTQRATKRDPSPVEGSRPSSTERSRNSGPLNAPSLRNTRTTEKAAMKVRRIQPEDGGKGKAAKDPVGESKDARKGQSQRMAAAEKSALNSAVDREAANSMKQARKGAVRDGVAKEKTSRRRATAREAVIEKDTVARDVSKVKMEKKAGIEGADSSSKKTPLRHIVKDRDEDKARTLRNVNAPRMAMIADEKGAKEKKLRKAKTPSVGDVTAKIGKQDRQVAPRVRQAPGKVSSSERQPIVVSKFSLKADERPLFAKKNRKTRSNGNSRVREGNVALNEGNAGIDEMNEDLRSGNQEEETPDVKFHKRMTKAKLSLLARSPLSRLLSKEEKDAAAEEVYGEGARYSSPSKRKTSEVDVDEVIPLDPSEPPRKKSRTGKGEDEPLDPAQLAARRKESRKLKRKIRQMRAKGELPDEEKEAPETGVVYLGHIPHGFYENEMRGYFSQFGEVTRVRLSRSKRTARSRGFAFIEFADKEVGMKAAESMDGYLMHGQKLVAKVVPPEKVHPDTFKGANKVFKKIPFSAIERRAMIQRSRDPLKLSQRSKGVQKKVKEKKDKLARKGIKYEFPDISPSVES